MTIFNEHFLLQSDTAQKLYFYYAAGLPIIDYHNHLPPDQIAIDKKFETLTEIWLKGDHYKWRAMRTLGVNEQYITGNTSDEEKFLAWARCVPLTLRNPLFHWTHMELKNPFGINHYLNEDSAAAIYKNGNEQLSGNGFSTRSLLQHFNVEMACTTDDPCDDLPHHKKIAADSVFTKVLPGFRPDKFLMIENHEVFIHYIVTLESLTGIDIIDFEALVNALQQRVNYFHQAGCRISDHGLSIMPSVTVMDTGMHAELGKHLKQRSNSHFPYAENFRGTLLLELCKMYEAKGWVQQFHLGAIRNNNSRMFAKLGADIGFDSIGNFNHALALSGFLNELDKTNQLTKTIFYNLNPSDNEVFATMAGNFNDGSVKGKIQFGSGWWFLDQLDGMTKQLNTLSSMGIISTFVGMLTDSRSFLSFPRHDYFRRLVCNLFGSEMDNGMLPNDDQWVGSIIKDICYRNAKQYFNL